MKIYFGVPGTGKTYQAAREAVRLIDQRVANDNESFTRRHNQLVRERRIFWVTFHPSYSYEDFVEGFRPETDNLGRLTYTVTDGPFKMACNECYKRNPISEIKVGDKLGRYEVIEIDAGGVVLKSKTDRSDKVIGENVQYADFWTINHLKSHKIAPHQLSLAGPRNEERKEVSRKTLLPSTLFTNSSHLRALYERLSESDDAELPHPVVLVIDEINRADLSRVFGELMTLLETDKRQGAPEERSILLPYSKQRFSVPPTLSVIGTMNTADRSLAVMDLALRRRFEFEEVQPDPSKCPDNYGGVNVSELISRWNHRITALLSRDYRIGHSELMENKLEKLRQKEGWGDNDSGKRRALAVSIKRKVLPLLLEYFHDNWRKAEVVLGNRGVLSQVLFDDVAALAGDLVDLSDHSSYRVAPWLDPESQTWNEEKFKTEISEV
jgi:5-methylcytosine-specific restriction protein B